MCVAPWPGNSDGGSTLLLALSELILKSGVGACDFPCICEKHKSPNDAVVNEKQSILSLESIFFLITAGVGMTYVLYRFAFRNTGGKDAVDNCHRRRIFV